MPVKPARLRSPMGPRQTRHARQAAQASRNGARMHLTGEPAIVSIKSHQPDDRPKGDPRVAAIARAFDARLAEAGIKKLPTTVPTPVESRSWVTVTNVHAAPRKSERLTGWSGVVANHDEHTPKNLCEQSGTITRRPNAPVGQRPSANRRPGPQDATGARI